MKFVHSPCDVVVYGNPKGNITNAIITIILVATIVAIILALQYYIQNQKAKDKKENRKNQNKETVCDICKTPSGEYNLCPKCFQDMQNGQLSKCNNCQRWYKKGSVCECVKNKNK